MDHTGSVYPNLVAMCRAYGRDPCTYRYRIKMGMSVKQALLLDTNYVRARPYNRPSQCK